MSKETMALKVLNLYAGIGGNRKHWRDVDVTAVEIDPEVAEEYGRLFPQDTVVEGDAHEFLRARHSEFDFIWSSPPCHTHSQMHKLSAKSDTKQNKNREAQYPDMRLYQEIIFLKHFFNGKWVVENVNPYYEPLIPGQERGRHLFWTNFYIPPFDGVPRDFQFSSGKHADREKLEEWLGIELSKNIYIKDSHDPGQVLRNAVHPELGAHVLNAARNEDRQTLKQYGIT